MGAGDVVAAAAISYPNASVKFVNETCAEGAYTLVYAEGVDPGQASECCQDLWSHSQASIWGKFAVLVRDTSGSYWGIDRSHFIEPKAVFELKGDSKGHYEDRKDPLLAALLACGNALVRESRIYVIHPASPWGPMPTRLPVACL